jgi:glycosyltransferase involved in cell wall biosynthesis
LCTIIISHRNYSELVGDCLLSILDQTYPNWECIVVDDYSENGERDRLLKIIQSLSHPRIRLIQNRQQIGQVGAFFAGFAEASGEFVSPLDPDDRLHPTYLAEMVRAHLNETLFAPIVSCEQKLLRIGAGLISGTYKGALRWKRGKRHYPLRINVHAPDDGTLLYFSNSERRWIWTTTSSMMVRRLAAKLLIPNKTLGYNSLDSYLGFGAHFLGGTLILERPLVYRGIHPKNDYISDNLFSMTQDLARENAPRISPQCRRDAVEAMFHNGVTGLISAKRLARLLRNHFDEEQMALLGSNCPEALEVWGQHRESQDTKSRVRRWFQNPLRNSNRKI